MTWRELADAIVPSDALRGVRTLEVPHDDHLTRRHRRGLDYRWRPSRRLGALRGAVRALQKVDGEVGLLPAEKAALEAAEAILDGGT